VWHFLRLWELRWLVRRQKGRRSLQHVRDDRVVS
jgi:hypothetical protein